MEWPFEDIVTAPIRMQPGGPGWGFPEAFNQYVSPIGRIPGSGIKGRKGTVPLTISSNDL